jgi:hypothetical protein
VKTKMAVFLTCSLFPVPCSLFPLPNIKFILHNYLFVGEAQNNEIIRNYVGWVVRSSVAEQWNVDAKQLLE